MACTHTHAKSPLDEIHIELSMSHINWHIYLIQYCYCSQMPDVVSEAATLSLSQMEDLIEDDHHPVHGDPMLSHHLLSSPCSPASPSSSLQGNDHHNGMNGHSRLSGGCTTNGNSDISMQHCDPLLSSSNHHHHNLQNNNHHHHHHMDIGSCIGDPILTSTHNLLASPHRTHVDSILASPDTDSLVSDIDMVAWSTV